MSFTSKSRIRQRFFDQISLAAFRDPSGETLAST